MGCCALPTGDQRAKCRCERSVAILQSGGRGSGCGLYSNLLEQFTDGAALVDAADGFAEQRRHRQHGEVANLLFSSERH